MDSACHEIGGSGPEVLQAEKREAEKHKSREYRIALNIFNKGPPERGIQFLIERGFFAHTTLQPLSISVANFLLREGEDGKTTVRNGLSKKMVGQYLGSRREDSSLVMKHVLAKIELKGLQLDEALRRFQKLIHVSG